MGLACTRANEFAAKAKITLVVVIAILFCRVGSTQVTPVDQSPPSITFPDWKEVPTDDPDYSEYTVSFPSAFITRFPENNTVPLRILLPAQHDKPLPVVIVLHYLGATDLNIENELGKELNDRSVAAVLITLPYHMSRTPVGRRSGQLIIQPDPAELIANMTQSVLDVRRTVDFIEQRKEFDPNHIGIAGTSLGSLVSILSYSLEPRIGTAAFMLGGIDLAHILWHSSRVEEIREMLRKRGYSEGRLRREIASVEPANYLSKRKSGNVFIIGGKYDTVIPPADTRKLMEAIPGAKVLWLDTGHYGGVFVEKRLLRTVADFFDRQYKGQSYSPPLRLYAPTLRVGALFNSFDGLQVGAGLDLFKAGKHGEFFSTLIVTPKGINLFAGAAVGHGLAFGAFGSQKRLGVGVWWSTVL